MNVKYNVLIKNISLCVGLMVLTLILNAQIISYNMMYVEQPTLYVANQHIHTFYDLFYQYLHPKFLQYKIPFFRPSGHYLMYYLLVPLLGWHNTQGFFVVSLLFLGLSGFVTIKLYQLLFPGYFIGGFLAFAIYLMHPALTLSRFSIMHFDFAYIFFSLAALYCFIMFVKENSNSFQKFSYLFAAIMLWIVAVTFKEAALMLGPVFFSYLCIESYNGKLNFNKQVFEILLLLIVLTITLLIYITWPWPTFFVNPLRPSLFAGFKLITIKELLKNFFCFSSQQDNTIFRAVTYSNYARLIVIIGTLFAISLFFSTLTLEEKKHSAFLLICGLLFLILPIGWGAAQPWHLSPTILFVSMLMGFAIEHKLFNFKLITMIALVVLAVVPLSNYENIKFLQTHNGFTFALNKNAVFNPPKVNVRPDSIIIAQDSLKRDAYSLGNSFYPFAIQSPEKLFVIRRTDAYTDFITYDPIYNGTLFKYAYLIPTLQEEDLPFSLDRLSKVPQVIIYNWLQNYNKLFYFTYNVNAQWFDETSVFKKKLLTEMKRRKLVMNQYKKIAFKAVDAHPLLRLIILNEDALSCELVCDKTPKCKAIVAVNANHARNLPLQCLLYADIKFAKESCKACTLYIKTNPVKWI